MKSIFLVFVLLFSANVMAALPPQYRMEEDLSTIVSFITSHEAVAATLKSIDMTSFTVHYGDGCWVKFGRKKVERPEGWVGPAPDLEVKRSNCTDQVGLPVPK